MYEYYTNKLNINTTFSPEKITSFKNNFNILRGTMLRDKRLVIKK